MMLHDIELVNLGFDNNCILNAVPVERRSQLIDNLSIHHYRKNTRLTSSSTQARDLYILLEGISIDVFSINNGEERALEIVKPGRILGDIETLSDSSVDYTLKLVTDCKFGKFNARVLHQIIQEEKLHKLVLDCHNRRFKRAKKYLRALHLATKEEKIRWALRVLVDKKTNKLSARNADIAAVVGCSKETVSRILKQLKREQSLR